MLLPKCLLRPLAFSQKAPSANTHSRIEPKPRNIIFNLIKETLQLHRELDKTKSKLLEAESKLWSKCLDAQNTAATKDDIESKTRVAERRPDEMVEALKAERANKESLKQDEVIKARGKLIERHGTTIEAQADMDMAEYMERDIEELEKVCGAALKLCAEDRLGVRGRST
ncbi:uncharacterized protein M421DRAFT_8533 [Didymella exigua CBS 183.55]|uniref:Uncharacterized protein n=1 Tax=Didymella exigua CBS 183.55 TaxID=1150837 RepID=A0A6A5R8U9_9PLEO|nr:uncharacterized protein M421DRAFT_8533 [Didymella exigua CBS 183.55]KAF1924661.1 hypothetical protein M421DRAFT_8533 [Didymella exigua CBS 183.55]